jgi:hypothetical protein
MRSFIHISSFANIAKLLTVIMEEKQAFQWTPEVEATFQTLKEALCTTPIPFTCSQERGSSLTQMHETLGFEECSPKYRMDRSK